MSAIPTPFSIDYRPGNPLARLVLKGLAPALERVTGLAALDDLYRRQPARATDAAFFGHALDVLDVMLRIGGPGRHDVPAEGPLVVVANHPLGALDGLAVGAVVASVRADVKVLGNSLLARIPELEPVCLGVDVYGGADARAANAAALRQALRWLRDGHALVVFPAGGVSDEASDSGAPVDGPWASTVARLALASGATTLPIFVDATASHLLRVAGRLHWLFRTALLPRELLRHRGRPLSVIVGSPIAAGRLTNEGTVEEATAYLRARAYALAPTATPAPAATGETIPPAADPRVIEDELRALPEEATLVVSGAWRVVVARAREAPEVVREIGRLREVTFRQAGEGTGRARDLDAHDHEYLHLVAWNADDRRIAGAYRMGPTDEIARRRRSAGLYTQTLFRIGRRLHDDLGPALELGRAFVIEAYQREFAPLLMLWRGIGAYVARHPRYRYLFGPVSLSADYPDITRQLMVAFLESRAMASPLAAHVAPRRRFAGGGSDVRLLARRVTRARSLDEVDALVRELDATGRGLPVLLRQYLKLNAKVLAFSVNPDFGGVVDGLMVVDLLEVPAAVLTRYMGRGGYAALVDFHRRASAEADAPADAPDSYWRRRGHSASALRM